MKTCSRTMIAVLLASGMAVVAIPAVAKDKPVAAAPAGGPDQKKISKPVRAALLEINKLVTAGDNAGVIARTKALQATALNPDEQFYVAASQLTAAQALKDDAATEEAIRIMATSPFLSAADRPRYINNLAILAQKRRDYVGVVKYREELVALNPADPETILNLALVYRELKQTPKAIETLGKAIDAKKASGAKVDESWYQTRLQLAYDGKTPEVQSASAALVSDYPTTTNWSNVLNIYRDSVNADDQLNLDTFRLMRAANALGGERVWQEYASTALEKGLPGEAKRVLDEGIAQKKLTGTKPIEKEIASVAAPKLKSDQASLPALERDAAKAPNGKTAMGTGDAYYGYGNYAKAAEMYRLAVAKSAGVDAATANLRLGAALAMAGDKAGATTAFNAVTGSPRAQLGKYWLIYLAQKA